MAVAHAHVVGDVVLQLVVAAAAGVHFEFPLRAVEYRAVELIGPDQFPAGRIGGGRQARTEEDGGKSNSLLHDGSTQGCSGVFLPSFTFTITAKVRKTSAALRALTPHTMILHEVVPTLSTWL